VKAYALTRQIVAMNDTATNLVLRVFARSEDAMAARNEIQQEYATLFGSESATQLVVRGKPLPVRLADFLVELGVKTIRHVITEHEVHDSLIVQPRAGVTLHS
jgi:hypothetical protein